MTEPNNQPRIHRRDLIRGRLWKLIRPSQLVARATRYPVLPSADPRPQRKNVQGISIEPVAPTGITMPSRRWTIPVFRPPGAIEEQQFLAGCTRCGDCITACPYDAIRNAPERLIGVAGTPVIDADISACLMCEDFPCIAACKPGVLTQAIPKIMGTAHITAHLCVAHHGTACSVCSEQCPVENAINVADGKPTINEAVCTGCGVCRNVCPAPENAILLMPTLQRPCATQRGC